MKALKRLARERRHRRVRSKIIGNKERPRFSVYRSNKHIYVQLIDDERSHTLAAANDFELKRTEGLTKTEVAKKVGKLIAKKAKTLGISRVVFDRGGYKFHGRVRACALGAKEGDLKFH